MPSWKKVITSGSDAELNSLYAPSITGSLHGTASNAVTASYVNPLQQTVLVTGSLIISSSNNTNDFQVGSNKLFVSSSGHVGIGTTTPGEKLEVSGKTKTTEFQMTTTPTAGYVLTSDASGNGTWSAAGGSASGVFGIADTSGVYTFYATLTLAMAAATSGQTIEMFADVTETGAVTITLKNGVNINGNGHTYTYTNTANNCFIDNSVAVDCQILNLKIVRQAATSTGSIFLITSGSSRIDFTGSYLFYNVTTPGNFYPIFNQTAAKILNVYARSTGTALYSLNTSTGRYINCYGESTGSGVGIAGNNIINSTGISVSGFGISVENGGTCINSTGISTSSTGIIGQQIRNSIGLSTSGDAINGYYVVNCFAKSSSGRAIAGFANLGEYHGCVVESDSNNVTNTNLAKVYNSSCRTNWNNAAGHCLSRANVVVNSYLQVANASANCIHYSSAISCQYANNTFKGATTPVNANVTQAIVNTQDNQGNILL